MGKEIRKIAVLSYSQDPGPRYVRQGEDSGEDFYHKILNSEFYNALMENKTLEVTLDETSGYASSFLDEAFGNLVYDFTLDIVKKNINIVSQEEPEWIEMLENESFIEWERRRIDGKEPQKTIGHSAWYRYDGNNFVAKIWVVISN